MANRYRKRRTFDNALKIYREQLKARGAKLIRHYSSPNMNYPSPSEMQNINTISHIWKQGDRFYKLAHKHYGDAKLWWVIAWFNRTPTESHVFNGKTIYIPQPLDVVLSFMRES